MRSHNCSVASVKLFTRMVSNGFWSVSRVKCEVYRKWWNFSIALATAKALSYMATYLLSALCSDLLAK